MVDYCTFEKTDISFSLKVSSTDTLFEIKNIFKKRAREGKKYHTKANKMIKFLFIITLETAIVSFYSGTSLLAQQSLIKDPTWI